MSANKQDTPQAPKSWTDYPLIVYIVAAGIAYGAIANVVGLF